MLDPLTRSYALYSEYISHGNSLGQHLFLSISLFITFFFAFLKEKLEERAINSRASPAVLAMK